MTHPGQPQASGLPRRPSFLAMTGIGLISLYRLLLSPWVGNACRYHPTCSAYGAEALKRHGFLHGSVLTVTRVCSCHPLSHRPWTDPVPERFAWRDVFRYNRPKPSQSPNKEN